MKNSFNVIDRTRSVFKPIYWWACDEVNLIKYSTNLTLAFYKIANLVTLAIDNANNLVFWCHF